MAGIYTHPAPGLGAMLPGWWDVPQNPIVAAQQGVTRVPSIGEIMGGKYTVPQNPIKDYVTNQVKPLGTSGNGGVGGLNGCGGGGCGCGGACGCGGSGGGMGGLGDISTDVSTMFGSLTSGDFSGAGTALMTLLQEPVSWAANLPLWGVAIAGWIAVSALSGHSRRLRGAR